MEHLVQLQEVPQAKEVYMLAGWRQWADAGSVSSGLPAYLIQHTGARKIGAFNPGGYYLFQIPGAHHLLRPVIKLVEGYTEALEESKNEFYYTGDEQKGLVIFLGDEPHLNIDGYAAAFFEAIRRLNVRQVAGVAGVYGPVPYDRERQISCIYSLPAMKEELDAYALSFSNYEGGSSIDSYLVSQAEKEGVSYFTYYAFVPAYDFIEASATTQGIRIENDYKAWYDIMRRINHQFGLNIDLNDLLGLSDRLRAAVSGKIGQLQVDMPQLDIGAYLAQISDEFTEQPFWPLDQVWEDELRHLFEDEE